jgi:hypothetical protein
MYKYFSAFLYFSQGVKGGLSEEDDWDNTTEMTTIMAIRTIIDNIKII